jgi:transcriptional regulator with XRE-family HTH domain
MSSQSAFSDLLREQRRTAGYSQEELADRAGVSVGAIGSLEQGIRRAPHRDTVKALADALSMSDAARKQLEEAAARARGRQRRKVSSIPPSLTSFVERNEVGELKGLVTDHRLLTITGSPGIGKTRIAVEVARRIEDSYDETWFVDLLPIREQDLVASQIALRLNVPVDGNDGLSGLIHHLRSRHVLLVIDNCEHVIADTAAVVGKLLPQCPSLTVLATSREALDATGQPDVVKHSAHTIGLYSSPIPDDREGRWILEAWTSAIREALALSVETERWAKLPALSQLVLTTASVMKPYNRTPGVHPFDFLAVAQAAYPGILQCCSAPRPSSPLFANLERWSEQPWRCLSCGSRIDPFISDTKQSIFRTYRRVVGLLAQAIELKRLTAAGEEPNPRQHARLHDSAAGSRHVSHARRQRDYRRPKRYERRANSRDAGSYRSS